MSSQHGRAAWRGLLTLAIALSALTSTIAPRQALAADTVSLTSLGSAYTQDFDTLASAGTANTAVPTGWEFSESGTNANATYRAGTGSDNTGDTYSFGAVSSTERAFGGLRSGSLVPLIGAQLTNNTGGTITSLAISYTGEQWRLGQNTTGRSADRLDFQLSTSATSLTSGAWTDYDALDFASPVVAGTVGALNGNAAPNRAAVSFTVTGLSIPSGAAFWIRWADTDLIPGADDGLSVDDFSLTPDGVIVADAAPAVTGTVPASGATDVAPGTNISVSFSEPVNVDAAAITLECPAGTPIAFSASAAAGITSLTLDPTASLPAGVTCALTIPAGAVRDVDGNDPPDTLVATFTTGFTTVAPCAAADTAIGAVQGSGAATLLTGQTVTVQGVVVGDYEGPSPALRGFYLQDAGDGDAATSDGIFVFAGDNLNRVALGDVVQVTGVAGENQGQTQISATTGIESCGATASATPAEVTLPFASATAAEQFEGMLVRLPQTLYVTEHFQLGRFGQVVLSSGGRLAQPTNVTTPGAAANALQAQNNLNRIILDDASQAQNPDPILFARGGQPLSASNTLRGGDTATGIVGVMTFTWAGNAASGNAYRVRPVGALGGSVNFEPANPRPAAPAVVAGGVKAATFNLLNYFNTFDGLPDSVDNCRNGVGGPATDCRGADTAAEFDRQWPKTVAAILALDADVIAVNEMENDGYGADSAIRHLVDRLNAATAPGTFAFIDVDAATGQLNALGTDAIKVGMIYRAASVAPVGQTAALNTVAFVNGGDGAPRSRPALAQSFEEVGSGARFTVVANHFKSKGSACDAPDAGDGQGNCNAVRTRAAQELVSWLAADPTGIQDPDTLIVGDLNSYAMEDPITTIERAGYVNLVKELLGPSAYSYVFDGQWGYLDHALASPGIAPQVAGVVEYHINADEPSVLDYNTDFKTPNLISTLYAPDRFRTSDHDPVVVGLSLNVAPTVDAGGPYSVIEGGSVALTATGSDSTYNTLSYAWDLDNDGSFETAGQSASFSAALLDGPTSATVSVQVTDGLGLTGVATTTIAVANANPSVAASFNAAGGVSCGANNATLTVTFSDPGAADTHTAVISWGDGATQTISGATSPLSVAHTYASAGSYTASVTVTDDDGGSGAATAAVAVNYTVVGGGVLQPINQNGSSVFKYGSTIPVKVRLANCDGSTPANLAPTIRLTILSNGTPVGEINEPVSTSAADTTGVMRFSSGQYIYNLATRPLPDPTATYRITITVPATGQTVTAQFGLR